jgi:hypothetical protein
VVTLPRIAPDSNNPHPSLGLRKIMRIYNAGSVSRRQEILALIGQWYWKKGFPDWYEEFEPTICRIYNAMSSTERQAVIGLFARYECRLRWR